MNCHDQLERMRSITKSKHDNDVTNHTSVISIEYDYELSRPIGQCTVYDKDEIRQQRDQSYRSALHRKEIELS